MSAELNNGGGRAARTPRIEAELAAARRLLESGTSEVDDVLNIVARRLQEDLDGRAGGARPPAAAGAAGAQEERAPAVVRVVVHRAKAGV